MRNDSYFFIRILLPIRIKICFCLDEIQLVVLAAGCSNGEEAVLSVDFF